MFNWIEKYIELSQREKMLLSLVAVVFAPLMAVQLILVPLQDYQTKNKERNINLEKRIETISKLGQELQYYDRLSNRNTQSLEKRINRILKQTKLLKRSNLSVGDRASVDQKLNLKLNDINLTELADLIHRIEHSRPVILINTLDLGPSFRNPKLFQIKLLLSSKK